MKIIYLINASIDKPSGVLFKINAQIEQWVENGHEAHLICLNPSKEFNKSELLLTNKVTSYYVTQAPEILKKYTNNAFFMFFDSIYQVNKIRKVIDKINPDILYVRELYGFPGVQKLFLKGKVILEANTHIAGELEVSSIKVKLVYQLFQAKIYNNIDGVVGMTNQITDSFKHFPIKRITISNGLKVDESKLLIKKHSSTQRPQLIIVGTPNQAWHGFDKIEIMARLIPEADFHIVGDSKDKYVKNQLGNLIAHGFLNQERLQELYQQMHIGIGTLALYRKNMNEACPLKVREYLSLGLPVIIAYNDVDINGESFCLQLPNSELGVEQNIDMIKKFINEWAYKTIEFKEIKRMISSELKEEQRLGFFEKVLHG